MYSKQSIFGGDCVFWRLMNNNMKTKHSSKEAFFLIVRSSSKSRIKNGIKKTSNI